MADTKILELLNATLGLSILLIALVLIRDFRTQLLSKDNKKNISLIFMGAGIIVFSIKELVKYGLAQGGETAIAELLETLYLLLTLGAFFSLLMVKELPSPKLKQN